MARLYNFFGLDEMARPKGTFGKTMRAALEKAREYGREFTVKQFCEWLAEQGVENPHPASVGIRLSKMTAGEGERPSTLQPLVKAQAGRRGPGGSGTFLYALNGPAGYTKPDPNAAEPDDEEQFDDDDAPAPSAEPRKPPPRWVPKADLNSGDWAEEAMAELAAGDLGPDHPMWLKVGEANSDLEVAKILGAENIPPQFKRKAQRVAKQIFTNLGKDWETGDVPAARPANTSAGDRKYDKSKAGKPRNPWDMNPMTNRDITHPDTPTTSKTTADPDKMAAFLAAMSKPPAKAEPEPEADDDDFIEPDDEPEAQQAGASQFLTPASPTPPPPQAQRGGPAPPPSASKPNAKNMAQLMKRFSPKR